jgi:60S ribosomal subunit assembly/export protein LOC1
MGPSRTKTVKNKFAAPKVSKVQNDGVVKARKTKGTPPAKGVHASAVSTLLNRQKKKKTYTAEELGIPKLNSITPVGVVKPKGKKKGKVFVDDPVCAGLGNFISFIRIFL